MAAIPTVRRVLSFVGGIRPPATMNLRNACASSINEKVTDLTILFQSNGGLLDEGFALYGFLRALPLKLTMHAISAVESIATIVFLAADHRFATAQSHFMLHPFTWPFAAQDYEMRNIAQISASLAMHGAKFEDVLKQRTSLSDEAIKDLKMFEKQTLFTPALAKEKGIIQDVKDASIPAGTTFFNVHY